MKPLVSIIIPVYNMQSYLPKCFESLNNQHFKDNVEILLIDDGSTDESPSMCDTMAMKDYHYRVIHQKNLGVAAARNKGVREAKGTYIAWVDPDDYVTDDWWSVLQPVLKKKPDMVYFDIYMLTGEKLKEVHFDQNSRIIPRNEWIWELACGNRIKSHLCSKIFLRTLLNHDRVFNEKFSYCEDYQALHQITWPINECVYLHDCLYVYRQRDDSLVHDSLKLLDNLKLGVDLSRERANFYRNRGIKIPDYGILHCKLQFCIEYQKHMAKPDFYLYKYYSEYIRELREREINIYKSRHFNIKYKIKLFLLLRHLWSMQIHKNNHV